MQTRRYIALSWQNIFCHVSFSESFSAHVILNFYKCASPTGEKFLPFEENCQRDQKKQCLKHLKGYIKNCDSTDVLRLLRVMRGADIILVEKIKISYSSLSGISRRPIFLYMWSSSATVKYLFLLNF